MGPVEGHAWGVNAPYDIERLPSARCHRIFISTCTYCITESLKMQAKTKKPEHQERKRHLDPTRPIFECISIKHPTGNTLALDHWG